MQKRKTKRGPLSRAWKWLVKKVAGRGCQVGILESLTSTKRRGR
jgi:hypothetical protein